MRAQRPLINHKLRCLRLAAGITEGQVAEEVARLVSARTGREAAIDGNYVSKLERGAITWPNRAYRQAFRAFFKVQSDAELGFYSRRTRRDAERWLAEPGPELAHDEAAVRPGGPDRPSRVGKFGKVFSVLAVTPLLAGPASQLT